jgi:hypothetical protein
MPRASSDAWRGGQRVRRQRLAQQGPAVAHEDAQPCQAQREDGQTDEVRRTDELGVSDNTVKTTVRHLLRKTTADTLHDLVQYVMRAALQRRSTTDPNAVKSSRPPARRAR